MSLGIKNLVTECNGTHKMHFLLHFFGNVFHSKLEIMYAIANIKQMIRKLNKHIR